jgi:hypothetical protein
VPDERYVNIFYRTGSLHFGESVKKNGESFFGMIPTNCYVREFIRWNAVSISDGRLIDEG